MALKGLLILNEYQHTRRTMEMKIYTAKGFPGIALHQTAAVCAGETKEQALKALNEELGKRSLGPLQEKDLKEFNIATGARLLQDGRTK